MISWRGRESHARRKSGRGGGGQSSLMLRYHSAFWRGLHRTRNADTSRQSGAFSNFPSPAASTHPPLPPQAQPLISAIPAGGSPESNYFSRGSAIHRSDGEKGAGVDGPWRAPLPRRAGLWAPAAPGGASRTLEGRAAPPPGLFVLPRGALRPGADVDPAEWQEISQRFPPTRSPGQSAPRGRCSGGRAHARSRTHASHEHSLPRALSPARPALPAARARFLGPSPSLGPDTAFWARQYCSPK